MIKSLKDLSTQLKQRVIGQDEAVNQLSVTVYKHLLRTCANGYLGFDIPPGENLLLIGPTGSGKSFLIEQIGKLLELPVIIINCPSICQEGWSGRSLIELISEQLSGRDAEEYSIVVLDEFDKMLMENYSTQGNQAVMIQASILKYIEGFQVIGSKGLKSFDTSRFLFIFAGAFTGLEETNSHVSGFQSELNLNATQTLEERLIKFGMLPEMAGRIRSIVKLNKLKEEDYRKIIKNSHAVYNKWMQFFTHFNIKSPKLNTQAIIDATIKRDVGVRGLYQELEKELNKIIKKNEDGLELENIWDLIHQDADIHKLGGDNDR